VILFAKDGASLEHETKAQKRTLRRFTRSAPSQRWTSVALTDWWASLFSGNPEWPDPRPDRRPARESEQRRRPLHRRRGEPAHRRVLRGHGTAAHGDLPLEGRPRGGEDATVRLTSGSARVESGCRAFRMRRRPPSSAACGCAAMLARREREAAHMGARAGRTSASIRARIHRPPPLLEPSGRRGRARIVEDLVELPLLLFGLNDRLGG